jgi:hypothetical protein
MTTEMRKQAEIDSDDRLIRLEDGLSALVSLVEGPSCRGELGHLSAMGFAHVLRLHAEEAGGSRPHSRRWPVLPGDRAIGLGPRRNGRTKLGRPYSGIRFTSTHFGALDESCSVSVPCV